MYTDRPEPMLWNVGGDPARDGGGRRPAPGHTGRSGAVRGRPASPLSVTVSIRPALTEADWAAVRAVRQRVFVEEQACPPEEEWDAHDAPGARGRSVHHVLAEADGVAVGCARWRAAGGAAKLERFAVLPEARGRGVARALVARTLADARAAGHRRFALHAQTYAAPLYAAFGFRETGAPFTEAGIEHVKMTLAD